MKAMAMSVEDRIFELAGREADGCKIIDMVIDEYGLEPEVARQTYLRVRTERGDPYRVATREAIARLGRIRFI